MTDLEKFLRASTRGLWGRERQTVRRELESHVRHRASRYEISGSSTQEAIKLAITDLGEAREISSGMKGVYSVPTTIRFGVLTAALATFGFMGAQLSTAQVTGTTKFPTPACLEQGKESFRISQNQVMPCESVFSISLESLRNVLIPLGVKFEYSKLQDATVIQFPEGNSATLFNYPLSAQKDIDGTDVTVPISKDYVPLFSFFEQLRSTTLPITFEGWDNPRITIGQTSFSLGSSGNVVKGAMVFADLLLGQLEGYFFGWEDEPLFPFESDHNLLDNAVPQSLRFTVLKKQFEYTIHTNLQPGTIAIVLSRDPLRLYSSSSNSSEVKTTTKARRAVIAPVAADGTIRYTSLSRSLAIVKANQVTQSVANGHATIAIAQFTGKYGLTSEVLEPVAPESIKIESR
jgi:hypothetical protein